MIDGGLAAIGFARPAVTPIFAVPAAVVAGLYAARRRTDELGVAFAGGALFALSFVVMESAWMAWAIGQPWPRVTAVLGDEKERLGGRSFRCSHSPIHCSER